jgi:hypothetical protein
MKLELIVFGLTGFLVYNTYHDGMYTKMLKNYTKYYKMATIAFVGFSLYLLMKKGDPKNSKDFIRCAGNLVKYMPVDKSVTTPFFDIMGSDVGMTGGGMGGGMKPQMKRMLNSGGNVSLGGNANNKRSVSETKKKYVASQQAWKCKHCSDMLDATFEVDHVVDLQFGGSNNVDNLVALCRNCHGKKTMQNHLK